jgi:photosystem II stability/assembly factor-like uncharacterized protein
VKALKYYFILVLITVFIVGCYDSYPVKSSMQISQVWTKVYDTTGSFRSFTKSGQYIFAGLEEGYNYYGGVYLSTNNGINWKKVSKGITYENVIELAASGSYLFAGSFSGLFRSSDSGNNWTAINNGITNQSIRKLYVSGNNIFAGTADGIFLSSDNGDNWSPVNEGLTEKYVTSLAGYGTYLFAGNYLGMFRSSNNGGSWTKINDVRIKSIRDIAISDTNIFVSVTGEGIFKSSDNGTNWIALNNNLTSMDIEKITFYGKNIFAGSGDWGVELSTNYGERWTVISSGIDYWYEIASLIVTDDYIFAGTNNGTIYRRPLTDLVK